MGSTRSAQQAHRDVINIQRMLSRLEVATEKQQQQPSTSYATSKDYYKTLSTLSSIRYAKNLLQEAVADDASQRDLSHRLDKLESHYQTILQNTPKPQATRPTHSLEHLRPVIPAVPADMPPEDAVKTGNEDGDIADMTPTLDTPEAKAAHALLPLGEESLDDGGATLRRRRSSSSGVPDTINPLSSSRSYDSGTSTRTFNGNSLSTSTNTRKKDAPNDTQSLSNLLSHHRSEQESLTEELATMASRLKMNSLEFSQLLEKDKGLMENAEEQLDGNLSGMIKERDRLKAYKKKGGVTTWFVIGSVFAVLIAWLFMFALMRIF